LRVSPHRTGTRPDTLAVAACQLGPPGVPWRAARDGAGSRPRAPPQAAEPDGSRGRSGSGNARKTALSWTGHASSATAMPERTSTRTAHLLTALAPASAASKDSIPPRVVDSLSFRVVCPVGLHDRGITAERHEKLIVSARCIHAAMVARATASRSIRRGSRPKRCGNDVVRARKRHDKRCRGAPSPQ
jgi:hypothetical protein